VRISACKRDAIQRDALAVAARINELAGKHGVAPSTIAKHALLLPVSLPEQPTWNARVVGWAR